ncbi:type II toxin-antitoxin system PemK/MazF family toxin [bacterium]|nr:type II toxin-antitoxin system PemK/MazF family toxin [bacterium]
MTKGKIVLVPFPFDDRSAVKVRPALCLTDPVGPHRRVVLAFISSRVSPQGEASDLVVHASSSDFAAAGLRVTSTIRLHRLMTVSSSIITRVLGELTPQLQLDVSGRLRALLSL